MIQIRSITILIQIDIDPHNPKGGQGVGHAWDVIRNGLTYSDTDYNDVYQHFGMKTTGCSGRDYRIFRDEDSS